MVRAECRLGHVLQMDMDLVIPGVKVELREEASAMKFVQEFLYHGDGEPILHRGCVESPVVDAESLGLVLFLDQKDRRRKRGSTGPDDALLQHSLTLCLQLILL